MGYQDRDYYQEEGQGGFRLALPRTMVGRLILVNIAVFLLDFFITSEGRDKHPLETLLAASPESFSPLYFWQFFTAGFVHSPTRIWHILGNMLMLWFFGRDVEARVGGKEFLRLYLIMLTITILGNCLRQFLFVPHYDEEGRSQWSSIIGASGAVTGLVVISVLRNPHAQILLFGVIPMPAWMFGLLIVVGDMLGAGSMLPPPSGGGPRVAYDAHLIGAAFGLAYVKLHWNFAWLMVPGRWFSLGRLARHSPLRVHQPDDEDDDKESDLEREADRLLAKVHREGEESLTARERRTLEEYSRRIRNKRH